MSTHENKHTEDHEGAIITVNRRKVKMHDKEATGLEIKQAAIAQGVPNVTLDFDLFRVNADTQHRVQDSESVKLLTELEFRMLRPDHNS